MSTQCQLWLDWLQDALAIEIRREVPKLNYVVDGFIESLPQNDHPEFCHIPAGSSVQLEYNGCAYHYCDKCYTDPSQKSPVTKQTALEMLDRDNKRRESLKRRYPNDYFVCYTSCQLETELKTNFEFRSFAKRHSHKPLLLSCREGFFGGICVAYRSFAKADVLEEPLRIDPDGKQIFFIDICSLYPSVNYFGKMKLECDSTFCLKHSGTYPLGEPIVRRNVKAATLDLNCCSLVHCTVLPPDDCFAPSLGIRTKAGLMLTLCERCCFEASKELCHHNDLDRSLWGCWTNEELKFGMAFAF